MGRIAIVIGGTRGIGAAIAHRLVKSGHRVAATYLGNDAAADACRCETEIPVYKWNVGDYGACEKGVARVCEDLGGSLEMLVNNAGITRDASLHKMMPEPWRAVIETDLTSCFNMCRVTIGSMRERAFGRIVNISSINGQRGHTARPTIPPRKLGALSSSKRRPWSRRRRASPSMPWHRATLRQAWLMPCRKTS